MIRNQIKSFYEYRIKWLPMKNNVFNYTFIKIQSIDVFCIFKNGFIVLKNNDSHIFLLIFKLKVLSFWYWRIDDLLEIFVINQNHGIRSLYEHNLWRFFSTACLFSLLRYYLGLQHVVALVVYRLELFSVVNT